MNAELGEDARHVVALCTDADVKLVGDRLVVAARAEGLEHSTRV